EALPSPSLGVVTGGALRACTGICIARTQSVLRTLISDRNGTRITHTCIPRHDGHDPQVLNDGIVHSLPKNVIVALQRLRQRDNDALALLLLSALMYRLRLSQSSVEGGSRGLLRLRRLASAKRHVGAGKVDEEVSGKGGGEAGAESAVGGVGGGGGEGAVERDEQRALLAEGGLVGLVVCGGVLRSSSSGGGGGATHLVEFVLVGGRGVCWLLRVVGREKLLRRQQLVEHRALGGVQPREHVGVHGGLTRFEERGQKVSKEGVFVELDGRRGDEEEEWMMKLDSQSRDEGVKSRRKRRREVVGLSRSRRAKER
ncbi:hypothetical protein IWZ00DRAFT_567922, partial [Phyllosticta capitalensis]